MICFPPKKQHPLKKRFMYPNSYHFSTSIQQSVLSIEGGERRCDAYTKPWASLLLLAKNGIQKSYLQMGSIHKHYLMQQTQGSKANFYNADQRYIPHTNTTGNNSHSTIALLTQLNGRDKIPVKHDIISLDWFIFHKNFLMPTPTILQEGLQGSHPTIFWRSGSHKYHYTSTSIIVLHNILPNDILAVVGGLHIISCEYWQNYTVVIHDLSTKHCNLYHSIIITYIPENNNIEMNHNNTLCLSPRWMGEVGWRGHGTICAAYHVIKKSKDQKMLCKRPKHLT